jgi:hypothetical protein
MLALLGGHAIGNLLLIVSDPSLFVVADSGKFLLLL